MTESVQGPELEIEPPPPDEAPAGSSWGSALLTMFGLAVIWGCFYLVALAQQVSDNKPAPAKAAAAPVAAARVPPEGAGKP